MMLRARDEIDKEMDAVGTDINAVRDNGSGSRYIDNAQELKKMVSSYNEELSDCENENRTQIRRNFEDYMDSCDENVNAQLSSISESHKEHLADFYTDILAGREEDEVRFEYDDAGKESYFDVSQLEAYHYFVQIGTENITYKKEYKDLSEKVKDFAEKARDNTYVYEVEKDGKKTEETGYLMTAEDIDRLMRWVTGPQEVDNIGELDTLKSRFLEKEKKDISTIAGAAEREKNAKFMESQKDWFYDDLAYYGAEDAESIAAYISEKQYTQFGRKEIEDIMDHFYSPDFKIEVTGMIPEEGSSTEEGDSTEAAAEEESAGSPVTTERSAEETEEKTEASTESETTEADDGQPEEEEILFKDTNELPVLDGEQLNTSIVEDILEPIQDNIMTSYVAMKKEWENLSSGLGQFRIEDYVDDNAKNDLEEDFRANVSSIENAVGSKEKEYAEYTDRVKEAGRDNLNAWQETIKEANEATHANIDKSLSGIRENRKSLNENNSMLLTDITNVLPYTRLGELENKEVYSFMTDPIEYQNISEDRKVTVDKPPEDETDYRLVLIAMAVLVLLSGGFLIVRITVKKRNSNIRNQNPDLL